MTKKEQKETILDEFLANCEKENLDEVAVFAINSKDRSKFMTCLKAEKATTAIAMIAMLIKILSEDTGTKSPKLAELIRDNLEEAEEKTEEYMRKKEEKRTIHIKITDCDE